MELSLLMLWNRRELALWPGFSSQMVFVADELGGWVSLNGALMEQGRLLCCCLLLMWRLSQWLEAFGPKSWSKEVLG